MLVVVISGCIGESQQMYVCPSGDTVSNPDLCPKEKYYSPPTTQPPATVPPTTTTTTLPPKPELSISSQVIKSVTPVSSGDLSIEISNNGNYRANGVRVNINGNDIQSQQSENLNIDEGSKITLSIPLTLTNLVPGQKNILIEVICSNCDKSISNSNLVFVNINPSDLLPKSPPPGSIISDRGCEGSEESEKYGGKFSQCEINYKIERSFATDLIAYTIVLVADSSSSANKLDKELKSDGQYSTRKIRDKQVLFTTETETAYGGLISQTGYVYIWRTDNVFFIVASNDYELAMDLIFSLPRM